LFFGLSQVYSDLSGRRNPSAATRHRPRACRPHLAENSPLDCFPGARCPFQGRLLGNMPGVSGAERPDLQSYAAACTPRAGPFLRQGACRPEQKRFPCRFAARKSLAISGKSEEDVLKGDLSPFKRASARQIRIYICLTIIRPQRHREPGQDVALSVPLPLPIHAHRQGEGVRQVAQAVVFRFEGAFALYASGEAVFHIP